MRLKAAAIRSTAQVVTIVTTAMAVASLGSAQGVGPEIPIWVGSTDSYRPSVAFNIAHEEFLVVWHNLQGPNTIDIYARRVNMDGSLGTWFAVVSGPMEFHVDPSLAFNNLRDEYLVAWEFLTPSGDLDILGSLVSWNGSSVGSPFVISGAVDLQVNPEVAFNPNADEFLVVYGNLWAGGLTDIAAQRVDGLGSLLSWATIASDAVFDRHTHTVAFSPEQNRYSIGYMVDRVSYLDVFVAGKTAPADLAGVSIAAEHVIANDPVDNSSNPAVAASADGFVALFDVGVNPRARRLAPDGVPLGPDGGFPVGQQNSLGIGSPQRANSVARADAVGSVAAWHQYSAVSRDVFAQAISPNSDRVLSPTFVLADSAADEGLVDIDCSPWGICLVVYQKDKDVVGRIVRLQVSGDDFESGDLSAWSGP